VGNVDESLSEIFMYAMALLFAVSLTAAHFAFKKILHKAGSLSDIKSKMTRYTTACIVRSALFEVPGLFAAVIVLVTGNILALAGSLVALLLLLFFRPSRQQVVQDLNLTIQEMLMLESPKKNR
ncbi:MAG TPA: hypothetical protein VD816_07480, partial [Ohtaekwangia sp.]|nr:hypothetical protein [Ohtaekwangia sp.]